MIDRLSEAWVNCPNMSPLELAAALRGASGTAALIEKSELIEMVWTGPKTGLVPSRHTEQVLLEVISSARFQIFLVSYVVYNINSVIKALKKAIERGVDVDILLESSVDHGGKVSINSIQTIRESIPEAHIYAWESDLKHEGLTGSVHAKCAVSDGKLAFITSANFTSAAMERNMELVLRPIIPECFFGNLSFE